MLQDQFYLKTESDAFFERWWKAEGKNFKGQLRNNKKNILNTINECMNINNKRVLEVGCFIGDLLAFLRDNHNCKIYGVETSKKACKYSLNKFNLKLEHSSFNQSKLFKFSNTSKNFFDLIIFDDVLSWMSRSNILQTLSVVDWMLKNDGAIFIRDFCPNFSFAFENHHQKGKNVFNFKQKNGHKQFFLDTGMYYEKFTKVYQDVGLQKIKTSRPDSALWSDTILFKSKEPLHPIISF